MERDLNLIRKILIKISDSKQAPPLEARDFHDLCEDDNVLNFHFRLLVDANYIEAIHHQTLGSNLYYGDFSIIRITMQGFDYLDNIRNEAIWKEVLRKIGKFGVNVSLAVISDVAQQTILTNIKAQIPS